MMEKILREIGSRVAVPCSWGWDQRFGALLLVLHPAEADRMGTELEAAFDWAWEDELPRDNVPPSVGALVEFLSGFRAGQTLYCTAVDETTVVYATKWPWSAQPMVSLRLGVYHSRGLSGQEDTGRLIKSIFNVSDE